MKFAIIDFSQENDVSSRKFIDSFVDGLHENNSDYQIIKIEDLNIVPCNECTKELTFEYSEKCRCEDDMNMLYPQLRILSNWVFVVPVINSYTITYFKNFLDRLEPMFQPLISINGTSDFNIPINMNNGTVSLIASSTSPNYENALLIEEEISSVCMLLSKNYVGALSANKVEEFMDPNSDNPRLGKMLPIIKKAGKELSTNKVFSAETLVSFSKI